jgi:hypothetical protein
MIDPSTLLLTALVAPGVSLLASSLALLACGLPIFLRATHTGAADIIAVLPFIETLANNRGIVFAVCGIILAFAGLMTQFRIVREKQRLFLFAMTTNGISTTVYALAFCLAYFPFRVFAPA